VEVVAMDGFTGFKTATTEELPEAVAVLDPFHVVRLGRVSRDCAGVVREGCRMSRSGVLSDAQWARVEPLLPSRAGLSGPQFRDHRLIIEGIVHRYRCGVPWRDVPARFGPWQTLWRRHQRFSRDGTWDAVLAVLTAQADAAGELDWAVSVDSTIVRVHQHAATASRTERPRGRSVRDAALHTGGGSE